MNKEQKELFIIIGDNLRKHRILKGLNRLKCSQIFGISANQIAKYEQGVDKPNMYFIDQALEFYGISFEELTEKIQDKQDHTLLLQIYRSLAELNKEQKLTINNLLKIIIKGVDKK